MRSYLARYRQPDTQFEPTHPDQGLSSLNAVAVDLIHVDCEVQGRRHIKQVAMRYCKIALSPSLQPDPCARDVF